MLFCGFVGILAAEWLVFQRAALVEKRGIYEEKQTHHQRSGRGEYCAGSWSWNRGDELLSINGKTIEDVFDYHYLVNDEYILLLVKKADGEEWELGSGERV